MGEKLSKSDFNREEVYIWTCPTCRASNHKFSDPVVGAVTSCDTCCGKVEITQ